MALRHYQGTPKPVAAVWHCPTCKAENTGPLEAGCPRCKAGADAKKVGPKPPPAAPPAPLVSAPEPEPIEPMLRTPSRQAFETWCIDAQCDPNEEVIAWDAWEAGIAWQLAQAREVSTPTTLPVATAQLILVVNEQEMQPLDPRARLTILEALKFYRDNHLGYGAQPGQLTADEVTDLIAQLSPEETA